MYGLALPIGTSTYCFYNKWYTHIEHLWIVHANRMNKHILDDPVYTYYPDRTPKRTVNLKPIFRDSDADAEEKEDFEG